LTLIEKFGNRSTDPSRAAISFAGMLAAQFGARVIRLDPDGGDPMRQWEPLDGQGSVLYGFLTQSKIVTRTIEAPHDSFLLTDDPGVLEAWSGPRSVYVRPLPVEN